MFWATARPCPHDRYRLFFGLYFEQMSLIRQKSNTRHLEFLDKPFADKNISENYDIKEHRRSFGLCTVKLMERIEEEENQETVVNLFLVS